MGFNHCYISTIENLQKELDNVGLEKFIKTYRSYDALSGPSESFEFIEQKIEEYEKVISDIVGRNDKLQKGNT